MSHKVINIYECSNGHKIVTIDRVQGVTPMTMQCRAEGCTCWSKSKWYAVDQTLTPTHEWYSPASLEGLSRPEAEHVRKGGLLIRKINT